MMHIFESEISKMRRLIGALLFIGMTAGAVFTSYLVMTKTSQWPRTDDASVEAELVHIAAGLPGRIVELAVKENDSVKKGQLLFKLEDTNYRLLRDQSAAQLDATLAALRDASKLNLVTKENAASATAEIDRARTNLNLADSTVKRLEPLAADGVTSQQTLDVARTALADAKVSLTVAQRTAHAAAYMIKSTDALEAEVRVAKAALALTEHTLSRTEIRAPFDGKVTGLKISEGSWVLPELAIFTLIDTSSWHVVGFFRETDLAKITPGQSVRVRVEAQPDTPLEGRVESIGWGVMSTDSLTLNGVLPFVSTSTDWVRLAKRFPVRISFDDAASASEWLRVGASASVVLEDQAGDTKADSNHSSDD